MKLTLFVVVISPLFCLTCLTSVLAGKQGGFQAKKNSHSRNNIINVGDFNDIPRAKTNKFGFPKISADESISAHDFSHSDPKFHGNREALEFTQLDSGNIDPKLEGSLATVERVLEDGKGLLENVLNEQLGIQVPTKLIDGHDEEYGLELIKMATSMLNDLLASPRHMSKLPSGIKSSLQKFADRRQLSGEAASRASNSASGDSAQVLRTLLELMEQLTKLGQDENIVQDPAFEKLLDRLKAHIQGFRTRPTLRT